MCADGAFTPGFSKYSEPGAGVVGAAQNGRPSGSTALLLWWTMGGRHFTAFSPDGFLHLERIYHTLSPGESMQHHQKGLRDPSHRFDFDEIICPQQLYIDEAKFSAMYF